MPTTTAASSCNSDQGVPGRLLLRGFLAVAGLFGVCESGEEEGQSRTDLRFRVLAWGVPAFQVGGV